MISSTSGSDKHWVYKNPINLEELNSSLVPILEMQYRQLLRRWVDLINRNTPHETEIDFVWEGVTLVKLTSEGLLLNEDNEECFNLNDISSLDGIRFLAQQVIK